MHLFNKSAGAFFGHKEVSDNAVFHRILIAQRYCPRTAQHHLLRIMTDCSHAGEPARSCGRMATTEGSFNTCLVLTNEGIRGTRVNGQVIGKHATKFFQHTKG